MGWGAVWRAAAVQFGAEPVELRILMVVAAAFALLMVLIGLRHAFHPARPAKSAVLAPEPPVRFAAPPMLTPAERLDPPAPQPFRAKKPTVRAARKSVKRTISRQQAPRPQIRRAH